MCPWESIILCCLISCMIGNIYNFLKSSAFKVQFKCHLTRIKADLFLFRCLTQLSLLQTHNRVLLLCVSLCACLPFPPSHSLSVPCGETLSWGPPDVLHTAWLVFSKYLLNYMERDTRIH